MNYRVLFKIIGAGLLIEGSFMLVPLIIALFNGTFDALGILLSIIICVAFGLPLALIKNNLPMRAREGIVGVVLCWIAISFAGAMPFFLSGAIQSFADSFFEAVSGFTTTGATILTDVSVLPASLLMWRALMHWIGGMGVLVFVLIIAERTNAKTLHIMSVESTGPEKSKLLPSIAGTAKTLYIIYGAFTGAEVIALLIAGMPVLDAFVHSFSTAGTGGFSLTNASVGAYNSVAVDIIITVFMFLFSISFTIHFFVLFKRNFKAAFKSSELRLYLIIVAVCIFIIAFNILETYGYNFGEALRRSAFHVVSVSSTTGFATADFTKWPMLSQCILIGLMFFGSMAGSTGGGIKYSRITIALKALRRDLKKSIYPNLVETVRMDERPVPEGVVSRVLIFIAAYFAVVGIAVIIISMDNFDFGTSFSSVVSAVSNVGPGISLIGPDGNFAIFSNVSKITLSICMIAGRLEILPFLVLFAPRAWRR